MTDEALFASGTGEAIAVLFGRYHRSLLGYLTRRFGGRVQEAEDCAQRVWAVVWHNAARFDAAKGTFQSWLFEVARRTYHANS